MEGLLLGSMSSSIDRRLGFDATLTRHRTQKKAGRVDVEKAHNNIIDRSKLRLELELYTIHHSLFPRLQLISSLHT